MGVDGAVGEAERDVARGPSGVGGGQRRARARLDKGVAALKRALRIVGVESEQEAIETVASGTGVVILPMSVARLHQRKDVVTRLVTDLDPTTIALVWKLERDDEVTQAFVGVTKGRTARSSR